MELEKLETIAHQLWEMLPESLWQGKEVGEIEEEIQGVMKEVGKLMLGKHVLRARIGEIEPEVEAGSRRCEECGGRYRVHQRGVAIHPKSVFGEVEVNRTQYVCEECGRFEMVADRELGLGGHQLTPRLGVMVAMCGASWSYQVAAAFIKFFLGVEISAKTVANVTRDEAMRPEPLPMESLRHPPGVVEMDGVLIRGRERDRWLEMKVASFFSQTVEVSHQRREVMDASFVASACQTWAAFEAPVTAEAQRRGLTCDEAIEFVADGASGIWSLQETVFPNAQPRLDLYHGKCKLTDRLGQAFGDSPHLPTHQSVIMTCFETGLVETAITYLQDLLPSSSTAQDAIHKLIGYLNRHRSHIPNYVQVVEAGGTVSSGLGEKANDLIVARRLKDPVMHWSRDGAHPVIEHRTAFINQHARSRIGSYETAFCFAFHQ